MHPSILAKRKAQAVGNIVWTAGALAKQFELDPALTEALQPKGIKDPATAEMMRMEALSDLLMAVGLQAGAVKEGAPDPIDEPAVTAVTPVLAPAANAETEPVNDPRPTLDDFPAHVVESRSEEEGDDFESKPKRRSTAKRTKKSSTG